MMLPVLGLWAFLTGRPDFTAWLHYEASVVHDVDDTDGHAHVRDLVLFGARLHGIVGKGHIGYSAGIDLAAGATLGGGGFAYDVALFPVGFGLRFLESDFVAVGVGVGAMGATGSIDDAVTFPVEVTGEGGSGATRLLLRARATWIVGADGRRGGAPSLDLADEVEGLVGLRVGSHGRDYGMQFGEGYFVGAAYRELYGARFVGLVVGYSISTAMNIKRH